MMFMIGRILFVNLKIVLGDVDYICSKEHIADTF